MTNPAYAGIDVAAKRGHHLCLLTAGREGALDATFFEPGAGDAVARTTALATPVAIAVDAPSGRRRHYLGPKSPARRALGLPAGRYENYRVCDAILTRRRLPLYQVPAPGEDAPAWMQAGFDLYQRLRRRGFALYRPPAEASTYEGALEGPETVDAHLLETYPDAAFCSLLGYRPPKKTSASGFEQRIQALKAAKVRDRSGLERRTLDELDACVAALTAYRFVRSEASWVGHPSEGVIVLPVPELKPTYTSVAVAAPERAPLR